MFLEASMAHPRITNPKGKCVCLFNRNGGQKTAPEGPAFVWTCAAEKRSLAHGEAIWVHLRTGTGPLSSTPTLAKTSLCASGGGGDLQLEGMLRPCLGLPRQVCQQLLPWY